MNKRILGALLVLTGLTVASISAKSKFSSYEFANKTQSSLMFTTKGGQAVEIESHEVFKPKMSTDGNFIEFKVCDKQDEHCIHARPSKKDSHTVICCNNIKAHSLDNKFDIHMDKDGSLSVKGTFFFNIFKD